MKQLKDLGNEYAMHDALLQLGLEHSPKFYLEIGTLYGDSLLRVLASTKLERLCIADKWEAGAGNGTGFDRSHAHIERMLAGLGYRDEVTFLDGDSAETIPTLDLTRPFDLVLVDGDHSKQAAHTDLWNAWPLVAPGGFLVFDDMLSEQHLSQLWTQFVACHFDIADAQVRMDKKCGVAVAVKNGKS